MKNVNQIKMLNSINMQYRDKKCITDVTNRGGNFHQVHSLNYKLDKQKMSWLFKSFCMSFQSSVNNQKATHTQTV